MNFVYPTPELAGHRLPGVEFLRRSRAAPPGADACSTYRPPRQSGPNGVDGAKADSRRTLRAVAARSRANGPLGGPPVPFSTTGDEVRLGFPGARSHSLTLRHWSSGSPGPKTLVRLPALVRSRLGARKPRPPTGPGALSRRPPGTAGQAEEVFARPRDQAGDAGR